MVCKNIVIMSLSCCRHSKGQLTGGRSMESIGKAEPSIQPASRGETAKSSVKNSSQAVLTCIAVLWLSAILAGLILHTGVVNVE